MVCWAPPDNYGSRETIAERGLVECGRITPMAGAPRHLTYVSRREHHYRHPPDIREHRMTPPVVQFSHVGLYVRDLPLMERFYTGFLGFLVTDRGALGAARLVFLSRDQREHHQVVLVSGRPDDARFSTVNQLSFRAKDLAALRHFQLLAPRHGATDIQAVTHGCALSVYLRDPEGNRLELFIDTPWYVTQPLREPMDLSLPDDELWRWAEQRARQLPGFRPAAQWQRDFAKRLDKS
jgi:catechol 2,3-dioxygenase